MCYGNSMRVEILTPDRTADYHACLEAMAPQLDAAA
jgi:hypothetical protein